MIVKCQGSSLILKGNYLCINPERETKTINNEKWRKLNYNKEGIIEDM